MAKTGGFFISDLFSIHRVIQNTMIVYAKELLVSTLKEYFAKDSRYHFVRDAWGFPKVIDHTDLHPDAGINDEDATRIWIGQEHKLDVPFYPAVIVKHSGATYRPISFNQDRECVQNEARLFIDGYGREYVTYVPRHFMFVGSWDTNFDVEISTKGMPDRSTLSEAIAMLLQTIALDDLTMAGLFVKSTRVSGESSEDYGNAKIFKQTVSVECRGEYRRVIPVGNIVEIIDVCAEFGTIDPPALAENMQINFRLDMLDIAMTA
jgi:hypothetical protein